MSCDAICHLISIHLKLVVKIDKHLAEMAINLPSVKITKLNLNVIVFASIGKV